MGCATSRSLASEFNVVLGRAPHGQISRTGKTSNAPYIVLVGAKSTTRVEEDRSMAFKPNYGRDRAERARAARERSEEKQRKKDEKGGAAQSRARCSRATTG